LGCKGIFLLIWNKEQLPTEWLQGIICSIYKKGEQAICSNYRPITLLNIAYKIFTILLNNRLSKILESILSEDQAGFRPNRSTLDNIRQTFEKCHEYNIDLHNIFVDYLQAFDSINRNKVTDSLNEYNISSKLIKLTALTLSGTSAMVKINNEFTGKFDVQTGVKQGDPLSATLFSIAMDSILTV
jgi:sorting nexin-29